MTLRLVPFEVRGGAMSSRGPDLCALIARCNSLQLGQSDRAKRYHQQLVQICGDAKTDRPELAYVRTKAQ